MNRVHENSIEAYKGILDRLPKSRAKVMSAIASRGPLTRNQIAESLNIPLASVCGRVRELLDDKLIQESGIQRVDNKPRATLMAVPPVPEQGRLAL